MTHRRYVALAMCFLGATHSWARSIDSGIARVDDILAELLKEHDDPCVVAVVADRERILAFGAAGSLRSGGDEPVRASSPFHIGSVSKPVTATMIATLVEEGRLDWETRVLDVLAEFRESSDRGWDHLTVRHLLSHTGGVPPFEEDEAFGKAPTFEGGPRRKRYEFTRWLLTSAPEAAPGSRHRYSNAGYAIAAAVAERLADRSYEDLVADRVFTELSLESAGSGPPVEADAPWGHSRRDATIHAHDPAEPVPFADLIRPAGDWHMNMQDLAAFGQAHLRGMLGDDGLLASGTVKVLHREVMDGYALGWNVSERYDHHLGGLEKMHTVILMIFKGDDPRVFAVGACIEESEILGPAVSRLRKELREKQAGIAGPPLPRTPEHLYKIAGSAVE